ncbi:MAB_1171c family putative transporter [Streptosporangium sp. NPDC006013]|uniref:MAB_1171c family putative transporter n=1 Tax=Streptosporangium sp. NPDC006013 TaxID=3155596 RepID=UPI0033B39E4D
MSIIDWAALVLLWAATLLRLPAARRSYQQRTLWGAFFWLAMSRVFSAEPVVTWLDTVTGMEWATLCRHLTGLASATCLLAYVEVISRGSRESRSHWIWPAAVVVIVILVVMFTARGGRIYWVDGAHAPGATSTPGRIYLAIFDFWLMYCLGMAGWMFAGYARVAPPLLRLGLVLSTIGMISGVLNRGHVMVINLASLFWPGTDAREWPVFGQTTFLLCIAGITAGTSIPAWRAASIKIRQVRALRDLHPLWEALTRQYPDVTLGMEGTLRVQLYRRVLEIRDGMLSLTSVVPPPTGDNPREVASWVASSLKEARSGQGKGTPSGIIPGPDFAGDIEREIAWLRQVAAAYKQIRRQTVASPVV